MQRLQGSFQSSDLFFSIFKPPVFLLTFVKEAYEFSSNALQLQTLPNDAKGYQLGQLSEINLETNLLLQEKYVKLMQQQLNKSYIETEL